MGEGEFPQGNPQTIHKECGKRRDGQGVDFFAISQRRSRVGISASSIEHPVSAAIFSISRNRRSNRSLTDTTATPALRAGKGGKLFRDPAEDRFMGTVLDRLLDVVPLS